MRRFIASLSFMKILPRVIVWILVICGLLSSANGAQVIAADAVSSVGIANFLPVRSEKIEDGDIIVASSKGYFVSSIPYDPQVVGVVTSKPAVALRTDKQQGGIPVVNMGIANTKVVGTNGNIKKGDTITTSAVPGAGMKATKSGYIIGEALEDVTFANDKEIKILPMTLNPHFLQLGSPLRSSLFDIFALSAIAAYDEPLRVFKYVISGVVIIVSFAFGFLIFSRVINTGIEALGRNPLAGRMIQLSIIFNVILVIIIIMSGLGLVYIFLRI